MNGTMVDAGEWDVLPRDGSQAWLGGVLMAASATVSVTALGWIVTAIGGFIMR